MLILFSGETDWAPIASLPRVSSRIQASLVGGRIRVNGGRDGGYNGPNYYSEVMTVPIMILGMKNMMQSIQLHGIDAIIP